MFDVVCFGSATQDVFVKSDTSKLIRISDILAEKEFLCYDYGSKVNIETIEFLTGGGATNTAVAFARLGLSSAFVGKVGKNDDAGARVIRELESENVDVRYAAYSGSQPTGYSVILVSYEGDRTALTFRGANNTLDENDINWRLLDETKWLYMSSLSGRSAEMAPIVARKAREKNVKLAFNPGTTQLKTKIRGLAGILGATDLVVMNREEAELVTGLQATHRHVDTQTCIECGKCIEACSEGVFQKTEAGIEARNIDACKRCGECFKACEAGAIQIEPWAYNLHDLFRALLETGTKLVVITDGKAGSQACDGETLYFFPAYSAPVVDTLGAGDAFASGFVAGMILYEDVPKAIQLGSANASSVVRYFGAKSGLLARDEAEDFIRQKETEKIYFVRKTHFDKSVEQ